MPATVSQSPTCCPCDQREISGRPVGGGVRLRARVTVGAALAAIALAGIVSWIVHAPAVNHWLALYTGTVNEQGPYYAFWSGFGSDIAEFGIIGAIGTSAYQLIRRFNCHEPGCWRIGNHPAAGGQFVLCYRHHPDYHGARPTTDMIKRLHEEHVKRQTTTRDQAGEDDRRHVDDRLDEDSRQLGRRRARSQKYGSR
jgi:hypothetical protein